MLLDNLHDQELAELQFALATGQRESVRDTINRIVWRGLALVWDQKIWSFWIIKTIRVSTLRPVWEKLFGPPPDGLLL